MNTPDRGCYRYLTERQTGILSKWKMPTAAEKQKVNSFFKAYVFYKNTPEGRLLTTSCCGKQDKKWPVKSRINDDNDMTLSHGKHNDEVRCPYCGAASQLKEISRLGKKKRLLEYQPVVFLKERKGELYALGAWAMKDYRGELTEVPVYKITRLYHFAPGQAEQYETHYGNWQCYPLRDNYDPVHRIITEPLADTTFYYNEVYCGYHVIGLEAIERSAYRYCCYDRFVTAGCRHVYDPEAFHHDLMKFLAACCIWPRSIEMLIKYGMTSVVEDLVAGRRKNSYIIKWGENDPKKALGLDGQELRAFSETDRNPRVLELYKRMRSAKFQPTFALAIKLERELYDEAINFVSLCKKRKVHPARLLHYIEKFTGPRCGGMGYYGISNAVQEWKDYTDFAAMLGYDLADEVVRLPKDLFLAHDAAMNEVAARMDVNLNNKAKTAKEIAEMAERQKSAEQRLKDWQKKYDFELDGLLIRTARTEREIVDEGKALKHCVGGYASRHMDGSVTILFLRRVDDPETPLVTVEMHGNRVWQMHGYQNDRNAAVKPREEYRAFFDTWIAWLEKGSQRTGAGRPIVSKKPKKEKTAAASVA